MSRQHEGAGGGLRLSVAYRRESPLDKDRGVDPERVRMSQARPLRARDTTEQTSCLASLRFARSSESILAVTPYTIITHRRSHCGSEPVTTWNQNSPFPPARIGIVGCGLPLVYQNSDGFLSSILRTQGGLLLGGRVTHSLEGLFMRIGTDPKRTAVVLASMRRCSRRECAALNTP